MSQFTGRYGRRMVGAVAALGLVLGVGACGGDDDDGGTAAAPAPAATQPSAAKPTGTPIKIMAVAAVDTPIQDYPDIWAAAKAAAEGINKEGGVNGQPIEVLTCNDKSEPNGAGACAREAVQEKVTAATGYSIGTGTILPILDNAGIQWVPGYIGGSPPDYTASNSWPLTGGSPLSVLAMPATLQAQGAKSVVPVVADVTASENNIKSVELGAKAAGMEVTRAIKIPIDATDFAPYVQQLKNSGADSATTTLSYQQILQLTKAAKQLNLDMPFVNLSLSMSPDLLKELGEDGEGLNITGTLPPPSSQDPAIKRFNQDMDDAAAAGVSDTDNRRAATVETWLAMHAIAEVAKQAKAPVDAASFTTALKAAQTVDLLGVLDWQPNAAGPKDFPRLANGTVYPMIVKDGQVVENGQPFDVFEKTGMSSGS